ncbi:hypothetical protein AXY1_31 [Achromobacter phage AXY1]|nr:hypothetical protein AXY1_31 [Achromobacter phage AXY1]
MKCFLTWLTDRLPARLISDNGVDYMIRFYLFTAFGRRFYIHKFLASDPDRGIHNHPWRKAWSFIMLGWYFEELRGLASENGRRVRKVRWFNSLVADSCHRVILPSDEPVWTLFVHTVGDVQEWGFFQRIDNLFEMISWRDERGNLYVEPDAREIYTPFQYPGGKKNSEWWKGAPNGRTLRENMQAYNRFAPK